ncbi:MAG: PhoU domain-containing protein [Acidobacteriota bacterium]|jgi:phosphate uptake regulator
MLERLFGPTAQPTLIASAFTEFSGMLQQAAKMYDLALAALLDGVPLEVSLHEMDDAIDDAEASIRRTVLEHLSLNPSRDLVASLLLISMVQDAERIGDFTRGLGDVRELARHAVDGPLAEELRAISARVRPLFDRCDKAFCDDDADAARVVVDSHIEIKAELSEYIAHVAASDESADMAIVYASTARNLQRVSAHLSNIASTVIQPFHRIRHDDEDGA